MADALARRRARGPQDPASQAKRFHELLRQGVTCQHCWLDMPVGFDDPAWDFDPDRALWTRKSDGMLLTQRHRLQRGVAAGNSLGQIAVTTRPGGGWEWIPCPACWDLRPEQRLTIAAACGHAGALAWLGPFQPSDMDTAVGEDPRPLGVVELADFLSAPYRVGVRVMVARAAVRATVTLVEGRCLPVVLQLALAENDWVELPTRANAERCRVHAHDFVAATQGRDRWITTAAALMNVPYDGLSQTAYHWTRVVRRAADIAGEEKVLGEIRRTLTDWALRIFNAG